MDNQDHKKPNVATGHEGHGVHLCHRCGWPFPNPHPSARHRRAHKKVCGKIEGYKIVKSAQDDHHLAGSDDEHGSDDDFHTPSPNMVKANPKELGSSGVGEKSNRSEDDVFSDAVMEFSESGINPSLEERIEIAKELNKTAEEKFVECEHDQRHLKDIDESAELTSVDKDGAGQLDEKDQSEKVILINDAGQSCGVHPDLVKSEIQRDLRVDNADGFSHSSIQQGLTNAEPESDNRNEIKITPVPLDCEDPKCPDHAVSPLKRNEDICDECDYDDAKDDPSVQDATSVADSCGVSKSTPIIGACSPDGETAENIDAAKVSDTMNFFGSTGAVDENTSSEGMSSTQTVGSLDASAAFDSSSIEPSDVISFASVDQKGKQRDGLSGHENAAGKDSNGEDCIETADENRDDESTDNIPVEIVSAQPGTDQVSSVLKEADSDAKDTEELSIIEDGYVEFRASGFQKSEVIGLDDMEVVELLPEIVQDKSYPASSLEDGISSLQVISELPNNNNVTSDIAKGAECVVAGTLVELEHNGDISSSEKTLGLPPLKESEHALNDSEFKNDTSAKDVNFSGDDAEGSAAINPVEPAHDGNSIMLSEKPKSPMSGMPEVLPVKKHSLTEASPDIDERHASGDAKTSKYLGIVSGENQPISSSAYSNDLNGDRNIISGESSRDAGSMPSQDVVDAKLKKERGDVSALDLSGSPVSRSDSLEGKCGSASETSETNLPKTKATSSDKDVFEPPSFMTLVRSSDKVDHSASAVEIETVQNSGQHLKPDSLQAGWFPTLTNVVNESEGRKKNEEIIAKVTNWSSGKQHGPLKNLLNEAKSPNMKQVPSANQNQTTFGTSGEGQKDAATQKDVGKDWNNSPARYPIEIKKKKGRPYWVPFVCCSSVHRDL